MAIHICRHCVSPIFAMLSIAKVHQYKKCSPANSSLWLIFARTHSLYMWQHKRQVLKHSQSDYKQKRVERETDTKKERNYINICIGNGGMETNSWRALSLSCCVYTHVWVCRACVLRLLTLSCVCVCGVSMYVRLYRKSSSLSSFVVSRLLFVGKIVWVLLTYSHSYSQTLSLYCECLIDLYSNNFFLNSFRRKASSNSSIVSHFNDNGINFCFSIDSRIENEQNYNCFIFRLK